MYTKEFVGMAVGFICFLVDLFNKKELLSLFKKIVSIFILKFFKNSLRKPSINRVKSFSGMHKLEVSISNIFKLKLKIKYIKKKE